MSITTDAVIVAAGSGSRLGYHLPKAFVPLGGRPLLSWSLDVFLNHPKIRNVILVVPAQMVKETEDKFQNPRTKIVIGGSERYESVRNGVKSSDADFVLIHDAARPFVTVKVIDDIMCKSDAYDCVFTATPVVDTIRKFSGDKAGDTIDRNELVRVGTPQFFKRDLLVKAFDKLNKADVLPTDEVMLMQRNGIDAAISWGDPNNFKITTVEDMIMAEALAKSM